MKSLISSGIFEGNGNIISNIYIKQDKNDIGLFGVIYESIIQNLSVSGNIETTGDYVGGIVGRTLAMDNKKIINCGNYCDILGNNYVGGIAGGSGGDIERCYNKGNISGKGTHIGGIVGNKNKGITKFCYNTGIIKGSQYIGGIFGMQGLTSRIINSYSVNKIER